MCKTTAVVGYRYLRSQGWLRGQQAEPGDPGEEGRVLRPSAQSGRQALTRGVGDEGVRHHKL